jgi:hypothetical protein
LKSLAERKLIEFEDENASHIKAFAEIHIMTRNLTKFLSMISLMEIPKNSDVRQVLKKISECTELHKPIKRADKTMLNALTGSIRYGNENPKVKTESEKAFVLLQSVIVENDLHEFSLRTEQAEIVEASLRLIKSLKELSLLHESGKVLESTVLLDRALHTRLWEWSKANVFKQCKGIPDDVVMRLQENGLFRFETVFGMSVNQIKAKIDCSLSDAVKVMEFTNTMFKSKLVFSSKIVGNNVNIEIEGTHPLPERSPVFYDLICYNALNGDLICYRNNIQSDTFQELRFSVPLKGPVPAESLKSALYASVVGLDFIIYPVIWKTCQTSPDTNEVVAPPEKKRRIQKIPKGSSSNKKVSQVVNPFENFKLQTPILPIIKHEPSFMLTQSATVSSSTCNFFTSSTNNSYLSETVPVKLPGSNEIPVIYFFSRNNRFILIFFRFMFAQYPITIVKTAMFLMKKPKSIISLTDTTNKRIFIMDILLLQCRTWLILFLLKKWMNLIKLSCRE